MNAARDSEEPARWLRHARDDLEAAERLLNLGDASTPRHVVNYAHQAAEKALKTVLILESVHVPRTHDLVALRGLQRRKAADSLLDSELDWLTKEAGGVRYPGDWIDADHDDAERALVLARVIVEDVIRRAQEAEHTES